MRTGIEPHSQSAGDGESATGKIPGKFARIPPAIRGRIAAADNAYLCGFEDIGNALDVQHKRRIVDLAKQMWISHVFPGYQMAIRVRQPLEIDIDTSPIRVLHRVDCILVQPQGGERGRFSGKYGRRCIECPQKEMPFADTNATGSSHGQPIKCSLILIWHDIPVL
jgi:hypothetical protein